MNKEELIKFNNHFQNFLDAYKKLEKEQHIMEIDKTINMAEVHTIVAIAKNQPINFIKLANLRNTSRSAATQMIKRLEKKNLVYRFFSEDNSKVQYLKLTDIGKKIYQEHEKQQRFLEIKLIDILENYSDRDIKNIIKMMSDIKELWETLPWSTR
ncbi:MAG: MarR family transcriptional regulator [Streptococcus sp.]|nr:MarR family transcriptional regulator [Streptococcus sp.]